MSAIGKIAKVYAFQQARASGLCCSERRERERRSTLGRSVPDGDGVCTLGCRMNDHGQLRVVDEVHGSHLDSVCPDRALRAEAGAKELDLRVPVARGVG